MPNALTYAIMTTIVIGAVIVYMWLNRRKYSTIHVPPGTSTGTWPPPGWNDQPNNNGNNGSTGNNGETWEEDNTLPPVYIPPQPAGTAETKNLLGQNYPRGMKNNNPGNIRISGNAWNGKIPVSQNTDGTFEQFTFYKYGVRAMLKLIRNYIGQGHNTIAKIINRYAPDTENHTTAYINFVAQNSGVNPNATINLNDFVLLQSIIIAMAHFENGRANAITPDDFATAWNIL